MDLSLVEVFSRDELWRWRVLCVEFIHCQHVGVINSSWGWYHRSQGHPDKLSDSPHVVIVYDMQLNSATESVIADVKLTSNFVAHIFKKKKPANAVNWWLPQVFQSISRDNSLPNICVTSALFGQEAFVNTSITLSILEKRIYSIWEPRSWWWVIARIETANHLPRLFWSGCSNSLRFLQGMILSSLCNTIILVSLCC